MLMSVALIRISLSFETGQYLDTVVSVHHVELGYNELQDTMEEYCTWYGVAYPPRSYTLWGTEIRGSWETLKPAPAGGLPWTASGDARRISALQSSCCDLKNLTCGI